MRDGGYVGGRGDVRRVETRPTGDGEVDEPIDEIMETDAEVEQTVSGVEETDAKVDETVSEVEVADAKVDETVSEAEETDAESDDMVSEVEELDAEVDESVSEADETNAARVRKRRQSAFLFVGGNSSDMNAPTSRVLVIAHRGASALRPEHTLAAYGLAIADGADFIEPDLVMTRDGAMVARHENELGRTTDVAGHPEFAARRTAKVIDGERVEGWFSEDFTLAELKTLRARERLPHCRGTRYDGEFPIVTLEEIIDFVALEAASRGRAVGIIPEIKRGSYFRQLGLPMEDRLLAALNAHRYTRTAPVVIQSFEIGNLKYLRGQLAARGQGHIRLLQLLDTGEKQPYDVVAAGGALSYARMMTPAGLREVATYADVIAPDARAVVPLTPAGALGTPTALVGDAHAVGLEVHPYTFRPENAYLPRDLWLGNDPDTFNEAGSIAEIRACLDAGIDGFFTDAPAIGRKALDGR